MKLSQIIASVFCFITLASSANAVTLTDLLRNGYVPFGVSSDAIGKHIIFLYKQGAAYVCNVTTEVSDCRLLDASNALR